MTEPVAGTHDQYGRERQLEAERDALAAALAHELDRRATGQHIRVEYPVLPRVRETSATSGGQALRSILTEGVDRYLRTLHDTIGVAGELSVLTVDQPAETTEPFWDNGWLPPLDAIMLCHFLRSLRPRTYLEIGSGSSTKFARWAVRTGALETRIVSIDPHPRAEIDELCDVVIRAGLQDSPAAHTFRQLAPGDVIFFDGSHYCFQNSDVAVFFSELIHAIPPGCIYGIHDIWLPDDYPEQWLDRHYNEQYVLAAWLLGGADCDEVEMPAAYVSRDPQFAVARQALIAASGAGPEHHGCAFWMRRT